MLLVFNKLLLKNRLPLLMPSTLDKALSRVNSCLGLSIHSCNYKGNKCIILITERIPHHLDKIQVAIERQYKYLHIQTTQTNVKFPLPSFYKCWSCLVAVWRDVNHLIFLTTVKVSEFGDSKRRLTREEGIIQKVH